MEAGLVGQSRNTVGKLNLKRIGYVKKEIRRRKCRKIKHPVSQVPMALQKLFVSCQKVFKGLGTVPQPHEVEKLCCILDNMKPEDVGLSSDLQFFNPKIQSRGTLRVTYTTIYKCDNFSLCIFFLPATGVIPLHNHPGMTVFSKLLLGEMHIKSYDMVHTQGSDDHNLMLTQKKNGLTVKLARLIADSVFKAPCNTSVLYPNRGGNIHEFRAVTPCAVLDVIGPPYSKEDGRDCSYYKDHPCKAFPNNMVATVMKDDESDHRYGWLEEIEVPENSQMDGIEYLGPQIEETSC